MERSVRSESQLQDNTNPPCQHSQWEEICTIFLFHICTIFRRKYAPYFRPIFQLFLRQKTYPSHSFKTLDVRVNFKIVKAVRNSTFTPRDGKKTENLTNTLHESKICKSLNCFTCHTEKVARNFLLTFKEKHVPNSQHRCKR